MTTATPIANTSTITHLGATIPFDAIDSPGAYVCDWSGHLLRVPASGVTPGRAPTFNIIGDSPLTVTKISDNPYIPVGKAKATATQLKLAVRF